MDNGCGSLRICRANFGNRCFRLKNVQKTKIFISFSKFFFSSENCAILRLHCKNAYVNASHPYAIVHCYIQSPLSIIQSNNQTECVIMSVVPLLHHYNLFGARGGAVGWVTALQARRTRVRFPMVSLEFFIDIIHPSALWPWNRLSL